MNRTAADRWKSEVLDAIFAGLAASQELDECLVYKGAQVLNVRLGGGRQSLDLDSNISESWAQRYPDREAQRAFLEREMPRAIRRHFERQEPVTYELIALTVRSYPPKNHPMGWDAFKIRINVANLGKSIRGVPALEIDVAAPEALLDTSVSTINVGGHQVFAYTLERIAGEKLRAFLSSLPAYRRKVTKRGNAVRAKDLYDIARIHRRHAIADVGFWTMVGEEFRSACRSRYVDCDGLSTFQEEWDVTRNTYAKEIVLEDLQFEKAEAVLRAVVQFLEANRFIPCSFPLPP